MEATRIIEKSKRTPIAPLLFKNKLSNIEMQNIYGGACDNVCYNSVKVEDCSTVKISIERCTEFYIGNGDECGMFLQCPSIDFTCESVKLVPFP